MNEEKVRQTFQNYAFKYKIRSMFWAGYTVKEIASILGVEEALIRKVIYGD